MQPIYMSDGFHTTESVMDWGRMDRGGCTKCVSEYETLGYAVA